MMNVNVRMSDIGVMVGIGRGYVGRMKEESRQLFLSWEAQSEVIE